MEIEVWTDGSGTAEGPYGWAAILRAISDQGDVKEREVCGYGDEGTNNVAELTAVIEGLRSLTRPCSPTVITDSQYVMFGFAPCDGKDEGRVARWKRNGWKCGDKERSDVKNQWLWEELAIEVERHEKVNWRHVKGHTKIAINERCDELAGKARQIAIDGLNEENLQDLLGGEHMDAIAKEAA